MRPPRPADAESILSALTMTPRVHPGPGRWALLRADDLAVLAMGDGPPRWALASSESPVSEPVVLAVGEGFGLRAVVIDPDGPLPDPAEELGAVAYELAAVHPSVATIEVAIAATTVALAAAVIAGEPLTTVAFHDPALWVILAWRVANDTEIAEVAAHRHWRLLATTVTARARNGFAQDWIVPSELIDACARMGADVLLARIGWGALSDDPRAGAALLASSDFHAAVGTLQLRAPTLFGVLQERAAALAAAAGMLTTP
jgi:hypothetical protein